MQDRGAAATGGAAWFAEPRGHRQLGSGAIDAHFQPRAVARDDDAMIWIARTTAAVPPPPRLR